MRRRSLADDERAAVYVEFLVVFMPLFMLFLGMIQIGFLFTGKIVVKHASVAAARSAIVVIPDDPAHYGGDNAAHSINFNATETPAIVRDALRVFGGLEVPENLLSRGDGRLNMIRIAAFMPLMAIAPPPEAVFNISSPASLAFDGDEETSKSVMSVIGMQSNSAAAARIASGLLYTSQAAAVTFPSGPGAGGVTIAGEQSFGPHNRETPDQLTARVSYAFACLVPGAAKIMCNSWGGLAADQPEGWHELSAAVARGVALLNGNGLYYILRSDATMTYQGAHYEYPAPTD